jgi:hypothetical protein
MGITLEIEDELAEDLRQEASAENTSVEELARRLVRDGLRQKVASKRWYSRNLRRIELINRDLDSRLSEAERAELEQLQAEIDRYLEQQSPLPFEFIEQLKRSASAEGLLDANENELPAKP